MLNLLVIGRSFCMLNLTVATVGQTYTVVKKEAERKRANQDAFDAIQKKVQADRGQLELS